MISICIASYNQSETLRDAIESALGQTPEIILVDDGSTDNSLEIAKSYPIKVISQVNKGLPSARNTGIMNATGEYVIFLDSDDIFMPNCIEVINKAIEETNADIIAPSMKNFGALNDTVILGHVTHQDFMTANRIGYFSAIRRSKLLEIGGYSPRMTWGYEDYHLWHNLLSRGATIHTIKDILVLHRISPNSMLSVSVQHHDELLAQINKDFYDTSKK